MPPIPKRSVSLSIAFLILLFSCSKPSGPGSLGNITIPHVPQNLHPFAVQVNFRQSNTSGIQWSASGDDFGDTVRYKVLLQGVTVDSNLLVLTDTLKNLSPDISYTGEVIAYDEYNDTASAAFTLGMLQGNVFWGDANGSFDCTNLFSDQFIWQSQIGMNSQFNGTPFVSNDTIFFSYGMTQTFAFNTKTGQKIWQSPVYTQGNTTTNLTNGGPCYYNGKIYVTNYGGIYCLNSSNGQMLWQYGNGDNYWTTPVLDNNMVFVGSVVHTINSWAFTAFDAASGALIWQKTVGGQPTSSPIVCNGMLYFGDEYSQIYAINESTGAVVWKADLSIPYNNIGSEFVAPTHYNNLIIVPANKGMYALNASTGAVVWQVSQGNVNATTSPMVSHDTLYFMAPSSATPPNGQTSLYALRATTGAKIFETTITKGYVSTPIICGGRLYIIGYLGIEIYDATNGSDIGSLVNSHLGAIQMNGVTYYPGESGMVQ